MDNKKDVIMTGTWRDTLFVWEGTLDATNKEESNTNKRDNSTAIRWKGSWVGCENCPDAKTAEPPSHRAFQESEMEFDVSAAAVGEASSTTTTTEDDSDSLFWKYEMTGGSGWDLGEGEEKSRHKDESHTILCQLPLLLVAQEGEAANKSKTDDYALVVANGENDFGAFVSVGCLHTTNNKDENSRLRLARRYLDHGDARAKWTVETLYDTILESIPGHFGPSTSTSNDDSTKHPMAAWQTNHLHAKKVSSRGKGKRKRGGDAK